MFCFNGPDTTLHFRVELIHHEGTLEGSISIVVVGVVVLHRRHPFYAHRAWLYTVYRFKPTDPILLCVRALRAPDRPLGRTRQPCSTVIDEPSERGTESLDFIFQVTRDCISVRPCHSFYIYIIDINLPPHVRRRYTWVCSSSPSFSCTVSFNTVRISDPCTRTDVYGCGACGACPALQWLCC